MSELTDQLRLFITNTGPHARLEVGGEIDAGNVHTLRDHLGLVVDAGTGDLDVDMANVTFCDSSGLAALVAAHRQLALHGRSMRVVNPSSQVKRLLRLSGLGELLHAHAAPSSTNHA